MTVGRHGKVKSMTTGTHFSERCFIGIVVCDGDLDASFFFKLLDQFWVCVVTPVVEI